MIPTNKRAISPVIATVIIVAVAIAVAIAVAYWVTGIIPAFTRYEEIKIINCYIEDNETAIIELQNTGSSDATIDNIFLKGRSPDAFTEIPLLSGDKTELTVDVDNYSDVDIYDSGVIYEFIIHSANGGSYPVSARAP